MGVKATWTKDMIADIIRGFSSIKQFRKKYSGAYEAMVRNGWTDLKELVVRTVPLPDNSPKWTRERISELALGCSSIKEFSKKYPRAYEKVKQKRWFDLLDGIRHNAPAVTWTRDKIKEIIDKCDTLTVLRDGKIIRTFEKEEFDPDLIRTSMIGRQLQGDYYRSDVDATHFSRVAVEVRDVSLPDRLNGVSFDAYEGEILGIGGLSSCGMHTLGKVLFGAEKPKTGSVSVGGKQVKDPRSAMKAGVGYAAKDRDTESLCLSASVKDNIASVGMDRFATAGFLIFPSEERKYVAARIDEMNVKCFSPDQPVSELSGGNKQKVVFSKWIGYGCDVLVLDCPTRGIDIGVKQMMYSLMYKMKTEGTTIIMISEELSELIGMSDRLLIMKDGRITKEFLRNAGLTDADIIGYMV